MTTEREPRDSLNIPVGHFPDRSARWLFEQADMEVESMAESIIELSERRGLERGIAQGETSAKQAAVLKLLQLRFENVPEAIATQVNAIQNVSRLDALFERALAATTLEYFDV